MEWCYYGQTGLVIDCKVTVESGSMDFDDIDTVYLKYKDPDGTEGSWVGSVYSVTDKIVRASLGLSNSLEVEGTWKVWPYFVMTDTRSIPGEPDEIKCIEEGDSPPR